MPKLTHIQISLLRAAAEKEEGMLYVPNAVTGVVRAKAIAGLLAQRLIQAVSSSPAMSIEPPYSDRPLRFRITDEGLAMIGQAESVAPVSHADSGAETAVAPRHPAARPSDYDAQWLEQQAGRGRRHHASGPQPALTSSKKARLLARISRAEGAPLDELITVTGWRPHTIRAVLSGLRKQGYVIQTIFGPSGGTVYRLTAQPPAGSPREHGRAVA
jgi:hypothetical protein